MNNGIEWSELSYTRTEPDLHALVGTWTPTDKTLRDMKDRGHYAISRHELTLLPDGTFSMRNMPDWWTDVWGKSHRKIESGKGTWKIEEDSFVFFGSLKRTTYDVRLAFPEYGHYATLHLSGQKPPYQLHITLGDPDSGEYMLFERTMLDV